MIAINRANPGDDDSRPSARTPATVIEPSSAPLVGKNGGEVSVGDPKYGLPVTLLMYSHES